MKTAIVHYWLTSMRGGEKVVEEFCRMFPDADIFTLVVDRSNISDVIKSHKITVSFLQRIGGKQHYQKMLPLMPFALENLDLTGYDLVISSESGPAKGIITNPDAIHVCYCHSPMRYIWDLESQYKKSAGILTSTLMSLFGPILRQWDVTTSHRVDHFIANSQYVSRRIMKFYKRNSIVINPPVNIDNFYISENFDGTYICAGQITPYKKIEIAVEAFTKMNKRLDVIGAGATTTLRKMAGPSVHFLGPLPDDELAQKFSECRALIFPGVEDFGIIPIEVMASGRPVIAFGRGGALETVAPGTGILFHQQTTEALISAVEEFESSERSFNPQFIRSHAEKFGASVFTHKIRDFFRNLDINI